MFDWKRLSKEEYALFGDCSVWEVRDLAIILSAFELELSGLYGDFRELFPVRRLIFDDSHNVIEEAYKDNFSKWLSYIMRSLSSETIEFHNINSKNDPIEAADDEGIMISIGSCCLNAKDFGEYLCADVDSGKIDFDVDKFADFLSGDGSAPSFKEVVSPMPVAEPAEPAEPVKNEKEIISDYFRGLRSVNLDKTKDKKVKLMKDLTEDLSGECTCTKKQAVDRIFKDKFGGSVDILKDKTGFRHLSFTRKVSSVLIEIEESKDPENRINRHENTEGFSYAKLPPCEKHPMK